jgi:hypothetical protein
MGLGTNQSTITTQANFIPELWSDEVLAAYKQNLILANLITNINFRGKKGDTLHLPVPARGDASVKAANTQVTLIADTATLIDVLINKHFEYSKLYEDIAEVQQLASARKFYTDDAGYALAKRIDRNLMLETHYLQSGNTTPAASNLFETGKIGGDGTTAFSGATPGNGTALTDAGLRRAIQTLEDADLTSSDLALIIPPVEASVLRGVSRFTEQAFRGDGSVLKTGILGNLYGVEVYVTSNCPFIHVNSVTSTQSVTFTSTAPTGASFVDEYGLTVDWNTTSPTDAKFRVCPLISKDAIALATQQGVRTQSQYKQEYLGTLVTTDAIFGTKTLRQYAGLALIVPA